MNAADTRHYDYDPPKARALIEAAGWGALRNGIRLNAKGDRLTLDFATTAGARSRETVQQVLQAQWRQLGVDVRIRNEPARVLFGQSLTRRNFAMAMFAWVSAPENVPRSTLHSSEIPSAANGYGGQNAAGFHDAELDQLIDAIALELDAKQRAAPWRRTEEIHTEQLPDLPLHFRSDSYVRPKWLFNRVQTGPQ